MFPNMDEAQHPDHQGSLLDRWMIWERAVSWLLARNMMKIRNDPFGPPIYSQSDDFTGEWEKLLRDEPFRFRHIRRQVKVMIG
jgi:hypothetical protein